MSGNSSFDSSGGFTDCDIHTRAVVMGPDRDVLATVTVGQILQIALQEALVAIAPAGVLGGINFLGAPKLVQCIRDGHEYVGEVANLKGALCEIDIRPK